MGCLVVNRFWKRNLNGDLFFSLLLFSNTAPATAPTYFWGAAAGAIKVIEQPRQPSENHPRHYF